MSRPSACAVRRMGAADADTARETFNVMGAVFAEDHTPLSGDYLQRLLSSDAFWAYTASVDGVVVGGMTAHVLPLTSGERFELFLYDIAVVDANQRRGVGRALVAELLADARSVGTGGSGLFGRWPGAFEAYGAAFGIGGSGLFGAAPRFGPPEAAAAFAPGALAALAPGTADPGLATLPLLALSPPIFKRLPIPKLNFTVRSLILISTSGLDANRSARSWRFSATS